MSTIADVIDRTFRAYLEPPDYQPAMGFLGTLMNADAGDTNVVFSSFAIPEDEQLLRLGLLIESGRELMRIVGYNGATKTATVLRQQQGSPLESHQVNDTVKISPPYPRQSVYEQVADNITALYPQLYQVRTRNLSPTQANVYGIPDELAVQVSRITDGQGSDINIQGRIIDYHPAVGGRALLVQGYHGEVWATWTRRMGEVTAETDTLDDLGVEERWVGVLMAGAAADLLVGRDISEAHGEWVGQILKAERVRVGSRQQLGFGLTQYRDVLIRRFAKEMDTEYTVEINMADPFAQVTNRSFG